VPERSEPESGHYFFVYRIRISNVGSETAQLMSRRWVITNGDGGEEIVEGPGVVGAQQVGVNTQQHEKGTGSGGKGSGGAAGPNRTEKGRTMPAGL